MDTHSWAQTTGECREVLWEKVDRDPSIYSEAPWTQTWFPQSHCHIDTHSHPKPDSWVGRDISQHTYLIVSYLWWEWLNWFSSMMASSWKVQDWQGFEWERVSRRDWPRGKEGQNQWVQRGCARDTEGKAQGYWILLFIVYISPLEPALPASLPKASLLYPCPVLFSSFNAFLPSVGAFPNLWEWRLS